LFFFIILVVGGGTFYHFLAELAGEPVGNLVLSIYHILSLMFLQPASTFPQAWYLEIFYFVIPLIGAMIFAQGVTEFGVMLFNRRTRSREWEMAVASTFSNHHVLIGLGHLGYRVVQHLHSMGQELVVIETNPKADLVANVKRMGIPVIQDDASRQAALEAAGIEHARAVVLCTQNDSLNLQVALKARRLNPSIHVVLRIFDDEFAQSLQEQFGFTAFSATNMAAPAFAAAAAGMEMTNPILVEGELLSLGSLKLVETSSLDQLSVGEVEARFNLSVVLLRRDHESDFHPSAETIVLVGDTLMVFGSPAAISLIAQKNTPSEK
jgi:Trk K+ transport system NAD-binding subunit